MIPLADLTTIRSTSEPTIVEREDRERVVTLTANPRGDAPIGLATAGVAKRCATRLSCPPGSGSSLAGTSNNSSTR
ncbi:MAG: hypothetical protein ACXWNK_04310 [Vulcanimicrobiaceae bacterium]